jgi:hypothetical protein
MASKTHKNSPPGSPGKQKAFRYPLSEFRGYKVPKTGWIQVTYVFPSPDVKNAYVEVVKGVGKPPWK